MTKLYDKNEEVFFEETVKEDVKEVTQEVTDVITPHPLDDVLAKVKTQFEENQSHQKAKKKPYFTSKKAKAVYDVSGTSLHPSKLTLVGGKFDTKYKAQLENIVFSKNDSINPDTLLPLLVLVGYIRAKAFPIRITCNGYSKLPHNLAQCLNEFFTENMPILEGIYEMFSNTSHIPLGADHE